MQARHFNLIAATLRGLTIDPHAHWEVIKTFADKLAETNPKFDRDRFIKACEVPNG